MKITEIHRKSLHQITRLCLQNTKTSILGVCPTSLLMTPLLVLQRQACTLWRVYLLVFITPRLRLSNALLYPSYWQNITEGLKRKGKKERKWTSIKYFVTNAHQIAPFWREYFKIFFRSEWPYTSDSFSYSFQKNYRTKWNTKMRKYKNILSKMDIKNKFPPLLKCTFSLFYSVLREHIPLEASCSYKNMLTFTSPFISGGASSFVGNSEAMRRPGKTSWSQYRLCGYSGNSATKRGKLIE